MIRKIFAGIFFLAAFAFCAKAAPVVQHFVDTKAATGEFQQSNPATDLTSENSGLNPGWSMTNLQTLRTAPPGDALPNLTATTAIVIEATTGHVIYSRNAENKMFPASTTKIMTLILGLEHGGLHETVTVGPNAFGVEGSSLFLEQGDKMPLGELLMGMMMLSGNDAAAAVAEHVDGTIPKFAEHMTRRARELGATGTNFTNPHGLPDPNHYTTAHDLALIAAHGYSLEKFEEIVSTKEKTFSWLHGDDKKLESENQMLDIYRGANGVKTGYTQAAGRCLVSAAKRDGVQLVAVVLDSLFMWHDSVALLDYGFAHTKTEKLFDANQIVEKVSAGSQKIPVKTAEKIIVPVFDGKKNFKVEYDLPASLENSVSKGDVVGKLRVTENGKEIASTDLLAAEDFSGSSSFGGQNSFFRMLLDSIKKILGLTTD